MSLPVFAGKGIGAVSCEWWKQLALQQSRKGKGAVIRCFDSGLHLTC
jgi:hypothetical protein